MIEQTLPCLRAWPRLAAHAGRDPATPADWLRDDGTVMRFGDVVLKHAPRNFPRVVRAHRQAARCLKTHPTDRATRLLGFDDATQVVMVAFVPGERLANLAHAGADPVALCGRVGQWLAAFHGAREVTEAAFDARGPLRHVPEAAEYLPEAYTEARARLAAQALALQGTRQRRAVLHGDLNASNLIVSGAVMTGIDFENLHAHPALRDAGQVLAALHLRAAEAPGQILPEPWRAAFEAAYGPCGALLDFFVLQRLLMHWARVPARTRHLGAARHHMAQNLARIFNA